MSIRRLKQGQLLTIYRGDPRINEILQYGPVGRTGIIPYLYENNTLYVLLGTKYNGKLTDFGGGCKVRYAEPIIECGLREFEEETGGTIIPPAPEELIIFVQGPRGRGHPHAILMYDYSEYDAVGPIVFIPNEEIASVDWYSLDEVYDHKEWADWGLKDFLNHITKEDLGNSLM